MTDKKEELIIPDFSDLQNNKKTPFQIIQTQITEILFPMFNLVFSKDDNGLIYFINDKTLDVDLHSLIKGQQVQIITLNNVALRALPLINV